VRILRAYHARLPRRPIRNAVLADIRDYLEHFGIDVEAAIPSGLISTLDSAVYSAGQIRDRFSPDGWLALKDLSKTIHQFATTVAPGDDATRAMTVILRKLAGFSGLLHENMYRLRRLAFPRNRPAFGTRHPDFPYACPAHQGSCAGRRARHDAGDRRQRHDPRGQYPVQAGRRTVDRPPGA